MRDEDQPKYLNTSETPIYKKSSVLYNLHRARDGMRRAGRAVLVEGYMDVIGVYSAGVKEVLASCGTALTNAQVRVIHRHADSVVLNFDPDAAGSTAAERAIPLLLDEGLHVRVLTLDGGLDPDEFVKHNGADAYRAKLDSAATYFHWLADRARGKFDMRTSDGRMAAFEFLLPAVQKVPDKLERAAIASDIASYLGVDPSLVLERFKKDATERRSSAPRPEPRVLIPAGERILLNALLSSVQAREQILPELTAAMTESFVSREIFEGLRHAVAVDPDFDFAALEARLSASAHTLLHEALAADDTSDEAVSYAQAQASLRRLEADFRRRRIDDLRARVRSAEREGRVDEALSLMAELDLLERKVKGVGGD